MSTNHEVLARITAFLRSIGIDVVEVALAPGTFLPGLEISKGQLLVDVSRLLAAGDLLHEAGHLAVVLSDVRRTADAAWFAEHPELEAHAIAWSYAAAVHLELPLEVLFHEAGYKGRSHALITTFSLGVYPGLPRLEAADMTLAPRRAQELGQAGYPAMKRWVRE